MLTFQCNDIANMIQAKSMIKNINEKKGIFIKVSVKANEVCHRLHSIPDLGPMVASAYFYEVGNGSACYKGHDVSASLELVPKPYSSVGKDKLLGISKRGNSYLRCLLMRGAKAVVFRAQKKDDELSCWINNLVKT